VSHDLNAYLILSGLLFAVGTFGFLARRNAIAMLMSIELMLNAVNLAIVAFGAFVPELAANGAVIALFVMAVAAGEATVGLAIVIAIYRNRRTPLVDEYSSMRE
jgi:NADH-quinone oxidoreductase subunit K